LQFKKVFISAKDRKFMLKKGLLFGSTLTVLLLLLSSISFRKSQPPNVLFICIDDLRPDLKCYGNDKIYSPNLDALAAESSLFTRHYVTQPTCGASRFSLLTGRRPRTAAELTNAAIERKISGEPRTELPETFVDQIRCSGYYTVGIGKISHSPDGYVYGYEEPKSNKLELPHSWDEMLLDAGKWVTGWNAFFAYADGSNRQSRNGDVKPYESADVSDDGYPDGLSAQLAVTKLNELAKKKQPFFLSVGFFKPHLPFNAPKKYWNLYDESKISLTPSPTIPENVHPASLQNNGEFNNYKDGDEEATLTHPVSDAYARKLRHAYYASVSYTDAQVGKVLDELKRLKLDKSTIVVVWSDHGWHLGDYRVWGKHTIFERAVRSVLMVKAPNTATGQQRDEIVSSIDIYPTMLELCRLKPATELDGKSFVPLLQKGKKPAWDNVAYSYFNRGISVRTNRYRFTKYFRKQEPTVELYDHDTDPNENHNVAEQNPEVVEKLTPVWARGNTGVYK
jgi:arylsulfatase A-like enzyme